MTAAVVIGLCRGLLGEEVLLTSMKEIQKKWEQTRLKKDKSHVMVTLKGGFKGETGDKWHMLLLVDIKYSVIKVIRWLYLDGGWWNIHSSGMLK